MKKLIAACILLLLFFTAIPFLALSTDNPSVSANSQPKQNVSVKEPQEDKNPSESDTKEETKDKPEETTQSSGKEKASSITAPSASAQSNLKKEGDGGTFKLYDASTKKTIEVSGREFCYGALATEMDTSWQKEALKAQTVAIYSYYSSLRAEQKNNPDKSLNGADFEVNCKIWKVYVPKAELEDKWSSTFEESYSIITQAVDEVFGSILLYEKTPAKAMFHPMSSGSTESHKEIYGDEIPYLTNVASPFDLNANNFSTQVCYSFDEFKEIAKTTWEDFSCDENPNTVIGKTTHTTCGSVKKIEIGNKAANGEAVKKAFDLRSSNFELLYTQDQFIFTVNGYGDGVGMSQNGANEMAKQGSSYAEILEHYYPGTVLSDNYTP